jgi:hypothetical protein
LEWCASIHGGKDGSTRVTCDQCIISPLINSNFFFSSK